MTTYFWHYGPNNVSCSCYLSSICWVIISTLLGVISRIEPLPKLKLCSMIPPSPPPHCKYGPAHTRISPLSTCDPRWCNACSSNHHSVYLIAFLAAWCWSKCVWNPSWSERPECCLYSEGNGAPQGLCWGLCRWQKRVTQTVHAPCFPLLSCCYLCMSDVSQFIFVCLSTFLSAPFNCLL